jgi:putative transcriptional regulator
MKKQRSAILEAVQGLHNAGVMDKTTLREFDQLCLQPVMGLLLSKTRKEQS